MSYWFGRRALPLMTALLLVVSGCGDDDSGSNPAGPSSPSNPPPSGVALIAGNWTGTSDFQKNGVRYISNFTATITQTDRQVSGNVVFTSPNFQGWTATISGSLAGTAQNTQFAGNITLLAQATVGTGTCIGQAALAGPSVQNSMRWEAASMNLVPNGSGQPQGCLGEVFTIVWIMGK